MTDEVTEETLVVLKPKTGPLYGGSEDTDDFGVGLELEGPTCSTSDS